jgi:hypothetical protein
MDPWMVWLSVWRTTKIWTGTVPGESVWIWYAKVRGSPVEAAGAPATETWGWVETSCRRLLGPGT